MSVGGCEKKMDYLTILEAQSNDTENCSNLFGNVSIVNTKILKILIEEIKLARNVIEAARTKVLPLVEESLKEFDRAGF